LIIGAAAHGSQSTKHEAQELKRAKVSLIEAIITAEKQGGGKATSAEFHFKGGNPAIYYVTVLSSDGKKLTKNELDPKTGDIGETHNELLEKLLTRIKPDDLRTAPTGLTHAILVAQEHSGGRALSADVDRSGDHLEYTIETVKVDGVSHKVKISSADGSVISDDVEK
jgi:uncharacterized membrane protein YkoI